MSFFKTKKILHGAGGCPVTHFQEVESTVQQDGSIVSFVETKNIDACDPVNNPSFPDPEEFNNLAMILASGVPLKAVNTKVIVHDDVAEVNEHLESLIPSESETPSIND